MGKLEEKEGQNDGRYLLLINPNQTPIAPLAEKLLLARNEHTENLWKNRQLSACLLYEVL